MHRDVKLENILLDASNRIKLIDFGLAANTMPGKKLKVHCGSPSYAAPEIVARRLYDGPPVDVWSLGVVLYGMICGHLPFHASDNKKVRHCCWLYKGKERKEKKRKEKKRKEKTTPFGIDLMRSQVLYRAAQFAGCTSVNCSDDVWGL